MKKLIAGLGAVVIALGIASRASAAITEERNGDALFLKTDTRLYDSKISVAQYGDYKEPDGNGGDRILPKLIQCVWGHGGMLDRLVDETVLKVWREFTGKNVTMIAGGNPFGCDVPDTHPQAVIFRRYDRVEVRDGGNNLLWAAEYEKAL